MTQWRRPSCRRSLCSLLRSGWNTTIGTYLHRLVFSYRMCSFVTAAVVCQTLTGRRQLEHITEGESYSNSLYAIKSKPFTRHLACALSRVGLKVEERKIIYDVHLYYYECTSLSLWKCVRVCKFILRIWHPKIKLVS